MVVREDLPSGYQAAQIAHAAGESAVDGPVPSGTHAVILAVPDEDALWDVHSDLIAYGPWPDGAHSSSFNGTHVVIHDSDPPRDWLHEWGVTRDGLKRGGAGEATAIGIPPTRDREGLKKALGGLRLLK